MEIAAAVHRVNAEIGLPTGWRAVWSTSRACWYWKSDAGEAVWTKPVRLSSAKSARSLSGAGDALLLPPTTTTAPAADADAAAAAEGSATVKDELPLGWTEHLSRSRGLPYWKRGDEVSWERPSS